MTGKARWSVLRILNDVHVFIEIPVLQKTFECLFHRHSSMNDNLTLLLETLPEEERIFLQEDTLILEKETGLVCDRWIDLHRLNVHDGMIFTVY